MYVGHQPTHIADRPNWASMVPQIAHFPGPTDVDRPPMELSWNRHQPSGYPPVRDMLAAANGDLHETSSCSLLGVRLHQPRFTRGLGDVVHAVRAVGGGLTGQPCGFAVPDAREPRRAVGTCNGSQPDVSRRPLRRPLAERPGEEPSGLPHADLQDLPVGDAVGLVLEAQVVAREQIARRARAAGRDVGDHDPLVVAQLDANAGLDVDPAAEVPGRRADQVGQARGPGPRRRNAPRRCSPARTVSRRTMSTSRGYEPSAVVAPVVRITPPAIACRRSWLRARPESPGPRVRGSPWRQHTRHGGGAPREAADVTVDFCACVIILYCLLPRGRYGDADRDATPQPPDKTQRVRPPIRRPVLTPAEERIMPGVHPGTQFANLAAK